MPKYNRSEKYLWCTSKQPHFGFMKPFEGTNALVIGDERSELFFVKGEAQTYKHEGKDDKVKESEKAAMSSFASMCDSLTSDMKKGRVIVYTNSPKYVYEIASRNADQSINEMRVWIEATFGFFRKESCIEACLSKPAK